MILINAMRIFKVNFPQPFLMLIIMGRQVLLMWFPLNSGSAWPITQEYKVSCFLPEVNFFLTYLLHNYGKCVLKAQYYSYNVVPTIIK